MAISNPPPRQNPLIIAITGFVISDMTLFTLQSSFISSLVRKSISANSLMSAPAMNALPEAPVRITTETPESVSISSKDRAISLRVAEFILFSCSGRFTVMIPILPFFSTRMLAML